MEDYDGDGFKNYEEYGASTNPCGQRDMPLGTPESSGGASTTAEESNFLAWLFFILGFFMLVGGSAYLIYYYQNNDRRENKTEFFTAAPSSTVPASQEPEWKSRWTELQRTRKEKMLQRRRESVFGGFNAQSTKIPRIQELLQQKSSTLKKIDRLAHHYRENKEDIAPGLRREEKDVFARLENIAQKTKKKEIGKVVSPKEAQDIFQRLQEITKKRKKNV